MGNSPFEADYITRGQLLPGPVLQTVTHSRDIKSLTDKNNNTGRTAFFLPLYSVKGDSCEYNSMFHFVFVVLLFAVLWVYLGKQLLLKSYALSGSEASVDLSLNIVRLIK